MNIQTGSESVLPLALRKHVPAKVQDDQLLGEPEQEWTWIPSGEFDISKLGVYATNGNSTTRQTGVGQLDHGEFQ
jgi:hypothetical protein